MTYFNQLTTKNWPVSFNYLPQCHKTRLSWIGRYQFRWDSNDYDV